MIVTDLTDFSGGIREASSPGDFSQKQWAQLKGFILTDTTQLRSQFAIQRVTNDSYISDVYPITGRNNKKYLIANIAGNMKYCVLPDDSSAASNATMKALTWTQIKNQTNGDVSVISPNTNNRGTMHFIGETRVYTETDGIRTGVLMNTVTIDSDNLVTYPNGEAPIVFYENSAGTGIKAQQYNVAGTTAAVYPGYLPAAPSNVSTFFDSSTNIMTVSWTPEAPGSSAILGYTIYNSNYTVAATAGATATSVAISGSSSGKTYIVRAYNSYGETPIAAAGGVQPPSPGFIPRANVGIFWEGQLILGDIRYYKDQTDVELVTPMTTSNTTRQSNMIWFSNPDSPDTFDPLATFTVGTPDCQIIGMKVVPQGLLVLTTSPTAGDGIFLLRGRSIGTITGDSLNLNFYLELLRGSIGGVPRPYSRGEILEVWSTIGTAAFIGENGNIWHTNTQDVMQLDEYGPKVKANASELDCVSIMDRYLFVSRNSKLYCMREFSQEGAWTEMVYPGHVQPVSMRAFDGAIYFIAGYGYTGDVEPYAGALMRILVRNAQTDANSERGMIDGSQVDLTISTKTLGDPNRFEKTMWHRVGIRAQGIRNAILKTITSYSGALFSTNGTPLTTTFPPTTVTGRFEKVAAAHGPSIEMFATFVLRGDMNVESVTVYNHGRNPRRI